MHTLPPDEQSPEKPKRKLNAKQRAFTEYYARYFNATRAAKEAGYSPDTAYAIGHKLLKKIEVQEALEEIYKRNAMQPAEIIQHLADIARGDVDAVLDDKGNVDLEKARANGVTRLIKKFKQRQITTEKSDIVELEAELYGRLEALKLLGQIHGMFNTNVDLTSGGKPLPANPITLIEVVLPPDDDPDSAP